MKFLLICQFLSDSGDSKKSDPYPLIRSGEIVGRDWASHTRIIVGEHHFAVTTSRSSHGFKAEFENYPRL